MHGRPQSREGDVAGLVDGRLAPTGKVIALAGGIGRVAAGIAIHLVSSGGVNHGIRAVVVALEPGHGNHLGVDRPLGGVGHVAMGVGCLIPTIEVVGEVLGLGTNGGGLGVSRRNLVLINGIGSDGGLSALGIPVIPGNRNELYPDCLIGRSTRHGLGNFRIPAGETIALASRSALETGGLGKDQDLIDLVGKDLFVLDAIVINDVVVFLVIGDVITVAVFFPHRGNDYIPVFIFGSTPARKDMILASRIGGIVVSYELMIFRVAISLLRRFGVAIEPSCGIEGNGRNATHFLVSALALTSFLTFVIKVCGVDYIPIAINVVFFQNATELLAFTDNASLYMLRTLACIIVGLAVIGKIRPCVGELMAPSRNLLVVAYYSAAFALVIFITLFSASRGVHDDGFPCMTKRIDLLVIGAVVTLGATRI